MRGFPRRGASVLPRRRTHTGYPIEDCTRCAVCTHLEVDHTWPYVYGLGMHTPKPSKLSQLLTRTQGHGPSMLPPPALPPDVVPVLDGDGYYRATLPPERRALDFGTALMLLRDGARVARLGWNDKGMHVELHHPTEPPITVPCLVLVCPDLGAVPWTISQTDALALDWVVVE